MLLCVELHAQRCGGLLQQTLHLARASSVQRPRHSMELFTYYMAAVSKAKTPICAHAMQLLSRADSTQRGPAGASSQHTLCSCTCQQMNMGRAEHCYSSGISRAGSLVIRAMSEFCVLGRHAHVRTGGVQRSAQRWSASSDTHCRAPERVLGARHVCQLDRVSASCVTSKEQRRPERRNLTDPTPQRRSEQSSRSQQRSEQLEQSRCHAQHRTQRRLAGAADYMTRGPSKALEKVALRQYIPVL